MRPEAAVAVDLGASGGRCVLGRLCKGRLEVSEEHRFSNHPIAFNGHLRWNLPSLFQEIKAGLALAGTRGAIIRSVGVDTWGVDFGLVGKGDVLLDLPVAYRDHRTTGCMEQVLELKSKQKIYAETGIQFLPFNTIYQLFALSRESPGVLAMARHLLLMPDLFAFLLTGEKVSEYTNATTTQLLSLRSRRWSRPLLRAIDVPDRVCPVVLAPGSVVARLNRDVREETGLSGSMFVATATHDTASAVAGIPAQASRWAYISCGTWSLMGMELAKPQTDAAALQENFTNEGGSENTIRFLKNIQGLWILQECQREWSKGRLILSNAELVRKAAAARPFQFLLDVDDPLFLSPPSMLESIKSFCQRTRQKIDWEPGAIARAVLESLALKHRQTLRTLSRLTGITPEVLHMVGGGSRNRLLCQWTADATGTLVLAGPAEATALGNIAVQGVALKWFANVREARKFIANSIRVIPYHPRRSGDWEEAEHRLGHLLGNQRTRVARA